MKLTFLFVVTSCAMEDFSWHIVTDRDSISVRSKKAEIALVGDQPQCPSCWAYAVADSLSDAYIINGIVSKRLHLSPLYLYMLMNSLGVCNGSCSMNGVMQYLARNNLNIAQEDCLSFNTYYWQTIILSCEAVLPSKVGCATSGRYTTYGIQRYDYETDATTEKIQQTILTNGPIVIKMAVDDHFDRGDFSSTNGIYFEKFGNTQFHHGMSIIGWGNEEFNGTRVFFWWCRNSWGTRWGTFGYVKYAGTNKLNSLQEPFVIITPGEIVSQLLPQHDTKFGYYIHVIVALVAGTVLGCLLDYVCNYHQMW